MVRLWVISNFFTLFCIFQTFSDHVLYLWFSKFNQKGKKASWKAVGREYDWWWGTRIILSLEETKMVWRPQKRKGVNLTSVHQVKSTGTDWPWEESLGRESGSILGDWLGWRWPLSTQQGIQEEHTHGRADKCGITVIEWPTASQAKQLDDAGYKAEEEDWQFFQKVWI